MKFDRLPSQLDLAIDLSPLDITQWDLRVWVALMLIAQALIIARIIVREVKRESSPVERLLRGRHFGGV